MAKSESTKIEFGYFHDYESEQFAFYRIPKVLFTDEYFRNLSSDAKVLYGLMLDRMALSIRHQWFDEEGNGEILDWRKLLLFVGIPFGIQKMFLLVVPRNVGTGEMLGLVVLKLMVGSWIGIGVLAWRLLAVAGILLKNGISGIIWIIKRLKEMVIKNERKATGKIVL